MLFPRVVACSTDWEDPWLTMEYYGYPTLAEVFVFENVDPAIWEQVFVHLRDIVVGGFMKRRRPLAAGVLEEMYLGKTRRRLAGITEPPALRALVAHEGPLVLNGREVANLPSPVEVAGRRGRAFGRQRAGMRRPRRSCACRTSSTTCAPGFAN